MRIQWILALSALPLAACGSDPEPAAPTDAPTENAAATAISEPAAPAAATQASANAQPAKLAQCKVCHTFEEGGADQLGPNLWGIYGKPAASDADFAYSTPLRNSGLVWDDASLDAYLADPRKTVPGGKMSFVGLKNPDDRKAVIEYLASLGADTE